MKKIVIVLFILVLLLLSQVDKSNENDFVIPEDAIRYRIIANSNSIEDQELKKEINKDIEPVINNILLEAKTIEGARQEINEAIPLIENKINNYNVEYKINYGYNYFPRKTLYGISYPAGDYESLVITLGKGLGNNWWCLLFPPLCLLEAKDEKTTEVNYTFYAKKIIDKFY